MSGAVAKRAHMIVTGVVQGVGFRMYAQRQARSLGLHGYVRNLPSGQVEIVAEGDDVAVGRLIAWARVGPPSAQVDDVRVQYAELTGESAGFDIRV
jgi:acylphosphatase